MKSQFRVTIEYEKREEEKKRKGKKMLQKENVAGVFMN